MQADRTTVRRSLSPLLIVAWLVVGIPAGWGVYQTVLKSMALFTAPAAATQPATR
jgi:hypothetical protein